MDEEEAEGAMLAVVQDMALRTMDFRTKNTALCVCRRPNLNSKTFSQKSLYSFFCLFEYNLAFFGNTFKECFV